MIEGVDSDKLVICSHYPPKKLGDKIESGRRIGFDQFRRMIMKHKPALWVNGHVHEDFGENDLMGTKVLNASSFDSGKAYSVTLDDGDVEVEEVVLVEE
jgi:Icc-related predicted phosphoesterase